MPSSAIAAATPPARLVDWEARLVAYLADTRSRPHRYGRHDCMLFLAGAIEAITGDDVGKEHRRRYRTPRGATRYLRRLGFRSPEAMIDSMLVEKPVGFAQRGDIVLAADGIPALCIGGVALCPGELADGSQCHVEKPREIWIRAWAV
jgi:hypothetical protein